MSAGLWRGRAAESLRRAAVHRTSAGFWRACARDAERIGNGAGAATLARRANASARLARWNVADARAYLGALAASVETAARRW